ncbi:MAG: amino-acid N-acetyltransferase [Spirochaetota bacterium]|nr:amino-acid N-acetyltransferase [Spirochaetota bacterium]
MATSAELEIIRESLGYAYRFRSKLFVINIDYPVIEDQFFPVLLKDIATLHQAGIRVVLVPGTREKVRVTLENYGITQEYYRGMRITTEEALPFVEMAAFNVANLLMSGLAASGIRSTIGSWVRARGRGIIDGVDYHYTGLVEGIDVPAIQTILESQMVPIFPPIGWNAGGRIYHLSAEELALSIASSLSVEKLFYMCDSSVMDRSSVRIPDGVTVNPGERISRLTVQEARELVRLNGDDGEMVRRIDLAMRACERGVNRVHIIDGMQEGVLLQEIFSNQGIGTMVHTNIFESIRPMERNDVSEVLRIMEPYITQGILLPRDTHSLEELYQDFFVYDIDGRVHGCAALHAYPDGMGEIAAVAVDRLFSKMGIGKRLVLYVLEQARERGFRRVFALTTQTADWFERLGFRNGGLEDISEQKRRAYNRSRNSKIYIYDL